jgi:hypothetical protein
MDYNFKVVESLREKLKKDYPILVNPTKFPKYRKNSLKLQSQFDSPVRSTFSSTEKSSMVKNSKKFRKINEINFGSSSKSNKPITIKIQEWEVVTSLDCFLNHISTKSYRKSIENGVPGFKKGILKEIKFPDVRTKIKKNRELILNSSNLELLGQKEITGSSNVMIKDNLAKVNRKINKQVKKWSLEEFKNPNMESQLIDYHTFRLKNIV